MTSLVFGLMINSAKNTFESIDTNLHAYATSLIIFDRTLKNYGDAAQDTRTSLATYLEHAIANPYRGDEALQHRKSPATQYLDDIGVTLAAITPRAVTRRRYWRTCASNLIHSSSSAGESSSNPRELFPYR